VSFETTGTKSTYQPVDIKHSGQDNIDDLLFKIKSIVKKERIRLGEFFLDHDLLRKGSVPISKFRTVLNAQKIYLTNEEYTLLEEHYKVSTDATKVNYVLFNEEMEKIFTEKDLEKDPLKKPAEFKAPSILDPKDVLNEQEEKELH